METAHAFNITSLGGPTATIEVDGVDLASRLQGYTLEHISGGFPILRLMAAKGKTLQVQGEALVREVVQDDGGSAVLEFLSHLDPGELEREVLADETGAPTGEVVIAVLSRWASGQ